MFWAFRQPNLEQPLWWLTVAGGSCSGYAFQEEPAWTTLRRASVFVTDIPYNWTTTEEGRMVFSTVGTDLIPPCSWMQCDN